MSTSRVFLSTLGVAVSLAGVALADDACPGRDVGPSGPTVTTTGAPTVSGTYTWFVDRYPAQTFEQVDGDSYGEAGVIHMQLGSCGYYTNTDTRPDNQWQTTFYDLQGNKTEPGIIPGTSEAHTRLYLPAGWEAPVDTTTVADHSVGDFQSPLFGASIADSNGDVQIYPRIAFVNKGSTRIRVSDSEDGWVDVDADISYDGWNDISIRLVKVEGDYVIQYWVNGDNVYSDNVEHLIGEVEGIYLKEIMVQANNNNSSEYDVYWADTYAANLRAPGDVISGDQTGDLVLVDEPAVLDDADIDGDLVVTDGSSTSGSAHVTGDGVVADGGTLGGNLEIDGDLANEGGNIAPGNSPGIISIGGNYTGSVSGPDDTIPSGTFEVDLSAAVPVAGTDYDQFNIGGTASGVTAITLSDLSVAGSDLGDLAAIKLIRIGDTTGNPATAFTQANRLVKNGQEIVLTYYTQSDITYPAYYGLTVSVAPETKAFGALPIMAVLGGEQMMGTYVDRRGADLSGTQPIWGRMFGGGFSLDAATGAQSSGNFRGMQGGMDLGSPVDGLRLGLTMAYGTVTGTLPQIGNIDVTAAAAGLYATYVAPDSGFYADGLMQYRGLWSTSAAGPSSLQINGYSLDFAAETGVRLQLGDGLSLTPRTQIVYQSMALDDYADDLFAASFDGASLIGRVGAVLQADLGPATLTASLDLVTGFDQSATVDVSDYTYAADGGGPAVDFKAAMDLAITPSARATFGGLYRRALDGDSTTYGLSAGLHVAF